MISNRIYYYKARHIGNIKRVYNHSVPTIFPEPKGRRKIYYHQLVINSNLIEKKNF